MYWEFPGTNIRLMGSLHYVPAKSPSLPKWAVEAFEWADSLVFESTLDPNVVMPAFRAAQPETLAGALSAGAWQTVEHLWFTKRPGVPIDMFKPWAFAISLSGLLMEVSPGVEPLFMQWAEEQSKPVSFLETPREMAQIADGIPRAELGSLVETVVSDITAPNRNLRELYDAWVNRDQERLLQVVRESPVFQFESVRKALISDRNRMWLQRIKALSQSPKRVLIAVGSLHCVGQDNLRELLGWRDRLV